MHALQTRRPDLQIAFTHFSPSAEGLGERLGADVSTYLPWDTGDSAERALDAIQPKVLAFSKTEVWPVLVEAAKRRGIGIALVGATVREGAGRMRWPARAVLRGTWESLDLACACTQADGQRLVALGVEPSAVQVTGDPAVDSAAHRVAEADPAAPWLAPFHVVGRPTVVAGSTWPEDEAVLAEAWPRVREAERRSLLVLAPHEPTTGRIESLLARFRRLDLRSVTLASVERSASVEGVDIVIVDRVGVLTHLYTVASVAFVGGGFGRGGLHSVLEPAAAGAPTLFGPRHGASLAAGELMGLGAAREVEGPAELEEAVRYWLSDGQEKARTSEKALDYIGAHRGAARRTSELLQPFIKEKSPNE
jgi:3-deoxy-D-manno-octulosonic-acid transferase